MELDELSEPLLDLVTMRSSKFKVQSSYIARPIRHWHTKRHSRQNAWYNVIKYIVNGEWRYTT